MVFIPLSHRPPKVAAFRRSRNQFKLQPAKNNRIEWFREHQRCMLWSTGEWNLCFSTERVEVLLHLPKYNPTPHPKHILKHSHPMWKEKETARNYKIKPRKIPKDEYKIRANLKCVGESAVADYDCSNFPKKVPEEVLNAEHCFV